jgi:hypothetical protein
MEVKIATESHVARANQRRTSFEEHCMTASSCGTAKVEAIPAIPRIEAT